MYHSLMHSTLFFSRISIGSLFLLQIIVISSLPNHTLAAIYSNETDKLALLEFKSQITEDPSGVLGSWNTSENFCDWEGVTCGLKHKRVIGLNLQGQKLAGTISPYVGNLSFLQVLNLGDNSLKGDITPNIGKLYRLQSLNLSFNSLGGQIPTNLSQCSNLEYLILDHNSLVGHIPNELGSLSNLAMLYLKNNNLTGNFPPSIGNLTLLRELYLSYNNLEGEVPNMSLMRSLTMLGLSVNSLSGVFPPSLYNLSSLKLLSLSFNKFHGDLRDDIGFAFPNLTNLYLATNNFSGPLPVSLTNASNLERLDLPYNSFTGTVPYGFGNIPNLWWFNILQNNFGNGGPNDLDFISSLTNCTQLQFLDIAKNSFEGVFPRSITNLSIELTTLLITGNRIYGEIPAEISNLVNLNMLSLDETALTGKIPDSIGNLQNLQRLHLESNQLTGEIPSSLGNISVLSLINLQNNKLEGHIPSSLGNFQSLQTLDLSSNKLSGSIPEEIFGISSILVVLDLSSNSFWGQIPKEVGNLTHLVEIYLLDNKFSGELPSTLGNCISLEILNFQNNSFSGEIPPLNTLKNLQYMDLSQNNISGPIPYYMTKLPSLVYLNLSSNNLEGEVPKQGIFKNSNDIAVSGNANLCGGIEELHLSPCHMKFHEKPKKHIAHKLVLVLIILSSCLALMIAILGYFCAKRRKNNKTQNSESPEGPVHRKISYEEILNGTSRFSPSNLIGSGNFGTVYKGTLSPDQTIVAIKVLNLQKKGASKSFISECEALRNIRHRNLVKILTACSSIDYEGNFFKALVYQYMQNESLEKWLYPEEGIAQGKSLTILQRLNIAIDVASALNYLHNHCETPVVHCDLKPSNVLLDNQFTAYVSDFGLAQLLCKYSTEATMDQYSSLGIKGTIGYAAPEYGMGGKVSTEGDVYSYGVLLLELFIGKRPTDDTFQDHLNLHNYVKTALPDQVMEIVDQSSLQIDAKGVGKNGSSSDSGYNDLAKVLLSIFKIGVSCSSESPKDRLKMEKVAMELQTVRDKLNRAGMHDLDGQPQNFVDGKEEVEIRELQGTSKNPMY